MPGQLGPPEGAPIAPASEETMAIDGVREGAVAWMHLAVTSTRSPMLEGTATALYPTCLTSLGRSGLKVVRSGGEGGASPIKEGGGGATLAQAHSGERPSGWGLGTRE